MCIPSSSTTSTAHRRSSSSIGTKVIHSKTQTVGDASKIRSRFLDRLGISPRNSQVACIPQSARQSPPRRQCQPSTKELLKTDNGVPDESLGPNSYSSTSSSPRNFGGRKKSNTRSVAFENAVVVHQIPTRLEYSDRIRNAVWTNSAEMQMNYTRNVIEFKAENWDYRQCVEEDHFFQTDCGQLIHPVHLQRERNLKWHFCAVMSAQQQQHQNVY